MIKFIFGYSTQGLILFVHTDVRRLVESAEHAHLRELGHTGQQHKLEVGVRFLENRIETLQDIAVMLFQQTLLPVNLDAVRSIQHIEQRLVVFVDKHDGTSAVLLVGSLQDITETVPGRCVVGTGSIKLFPTTQGIFYFLFQCTGFDKILPTKREMEYRVFRPFLFQSINGQPLEQVLLPLEISLEGRHQQALPETARTAKKVNFPFRDQSVDKFRLVHIYITATDDAFEILYSYRIFHCLSHNS